MRTMSFLSEPTLGQPLWSATAPKRRRQRRQSKPDKARLLPGPVQASYRTLTARSASTLEVGRKTGSVLWSRRRNRSCDGRQPAPCSCTNLAPARRGSVGPLCAYFAQFDSPSSCPGLPPAIHVLPAYSGIALLFSASYWT